MKQSTFTPAPGGIQPLQDHAINHARQSLLGLSTDGSFLACMSENQHIQLRSMGQRLLALLLQYTSHAAGAEAFLDEGRRIAREYSQICSQVGLSVQETAGVFLFFRRSILDAVYDTSCLGGRDDPEGMRLYSRSNDFFDQLLVDLIEGYVEGM